MTRIYYSSSIGNGYAIDNGIDRPEDRVAASITRKLGGTKKYVRTDGYRDGKAMYSMVAADGNGAVIRNNIWFELD